MSTRVLVVTTRTAFAEALSVALRASDLDYVGARRLDDALRVVADEKMPAAVVVDLLTTTGDPAELCDAVRAREDGAQVPVIFLGSGSEAIKSTTDALIVGGDGYFHLPVEAQKIVAKIATYVGCPVPELPSNLMLTAEQGGEFDSDVRTPPPPDFVEAMDEVEPAEFTEQTVPMPRPVSMEPQPARSDFAEVTDAMELEAVAAAIAQSARADAGRTFSDQLADDLSNEIQAEATKAALADEQRAREADERKRQSEREALEAAALAAEAGRQAAERTAELERLREEAAAESRRVAEERARLEELEQQRRVAEREAEAALVEAGRRATEERALLDELEKARAAAEEEARLALEEASRKSAVQLARLEELAALRIAAEADARAALEEAARRSAEEESRLDELAAARIAAEEDARVALAEAARKSAEEQARLDELAKVRAAAEADAARALKDAQRRGAEEQAKLLELELQREQAEADAARAIEAAGRREAEERARLEEIAALRQEAEADAQRNSEESSRREAEERARLEEIGAERARAEDEAMAALAVAAAREAEERRKLEELARRREEAEAESRQALEEHAAREREAKAQLEITRGREAEERARLGEIAERRRQAEHDAERALASTREQANAAQAALDETRRQEVEERARLAEIEQVRARAIEEAARAGEHMRQREEEERARLSRLVEERTRLEDTARQESEQRARREREEQARLDALAAERARSEAELRAGLEERAAQLAVEEERLVAIKRARVEAEIEGQRQQEERERLEAEAEDRLGEARRMRARLEVEAQQELERLARTRAEEELARRELEEKRTRARLSFQSGRFDAVPTGQATSSTDVGSHLRPSTDAQGIILGGPLPGATPLDVEPPPPPPFVPLEPTAGRFAEGELPSLLWACLHLKVTGAIEVVLDDGRTRTLFLEEGEPVLVASTLPQDRPEEGLLRAGLITAARYNELRAGPLRSPRRTAAALVAEGLLKSEELFPAVRGVLTEQVLAFFEHEAGTFSYREEYAHAADRARLEHRFDALLAEGVRRKFDERRLWLVLGGPSSIVGPDNRAHDLPPLSPEEKLALARLDGTRSLEDVVLETGIGASVVLRTALIAVSSGAARLLARGMPSDPAEKQAQRERSVAIDRARVLDRLNAARNGDYFNFLGIDVQASPFEVQRAAERVRQRFDPMRFADPVFHDLHAALKEIVEVTYDAEAVLGDPALAEGYRRNLIGQLPRSLKKRA